MNCSKGHRMFSYDDVNFECKHKNDNGKTCGEVKYLASNADRILHLTTPQALGGMGRPTCPVCGRVSVPNNGGFACIHCSAYYELPPDERPPRILLMPRRAESLPGYMAVAMVMLACNLIIAGAMFFGG